jgi:hypothetical protein
MIVDLEKECMYTATPRTESPGTRTTYINLYIQNEKTASPPAIQRSFKRPSSPIYPTSPL